jgi:hypothetical protein
MRDYHQWKTGVRVDGLFGPLGMIGTVISFFTGLVYPAIYEKMGLLDDYDVLYDDNIRNNLFEVLILCSAVGAFLNLVPFWFYDLTENKHKAYVGVLKIRTMFENYSLGELEDGEFEDAMSIIIEAKGLYTQEKESVAKGLNKAERKRIKERNLAIERASIIMQDLEKFTTESGIKRVVEAKKDVLNGNMYIYDDAKNQLKLAKKLPKTNKIEKEIREDEINRARVKKQALALVKKYGEENIKEPNILEKEEILNRETKNFKESMTQRKDLRVYLKKESIYLRATKPFREADNLIKQSENYTHYEELVEKYETLTA